MRRSLNVVLLVIFLAILANRLYFLYYGIANITTLIFILGAFAISIDRTLILITNQKWKKHNLRISFWAVIAGMLVLELSLRFYLKQNVQVTEHQFWGSYYSPYRNILLENKRRLKQNKDVDVALRVYSPHSERIEQNGEFSYLHSFNNVGIRSDDLSDVGLDSSTVILGLGDSFTEGVGSPQDSTWVKLLHETLAIDHPDITTINAGYRGSDLFYEYYKLDKLFLGLYQPDIVIIALNETEINDVMIRGGMERFIRKNKVKYNQPPAWEYLYAFSFISRYIIHNILHKDWHFKNKNDFELAKETVLNQICNGIENEFNDLARSEGFDLFVLYIPMQHEVELDWKTFSACAVELSASGIHIINLLDHFQGLEGKTGDYYWPRDRHLNSKGNEQVAKILNQIINRKITKEL